MCSVVKNEFKLSNVWLNHHKPEAFYTSQWRFPWPVFVIYRLLMAAYCVFAFTKLIVKGREPPHNIMVYLTTWTYLVLTLHVVHAACIAVWCQCRGRSRSQKENVTNIKTISSNSNCYNNSSFSHERCHNDYNTNSNKNTTVGTYDGVLSLHVQEPAILDNRMPWYFKLSWLLWNIVCVDAIIVTSIYFGVLYVKIQQQSGHPGIGFDNLNVHVLNTVFVVVDVAVSARPVRLLHAIYPFMYSVVYTIFSIIYWCHDHSNVIYSILNWNNAGFTTGVVGVVGLVIVPILQCCHFALYRLRLFIYKKIYREDY